MAAERVEDERIEDGEEDEFIDPNDVLVEVAEDGDLPMDEDDEEGCAEGAT